MFVTADPVRGQHVTVKSAIISTTNPYCTTSRAASKKNKRVLQQHSNNNIRAVPVSVTSSNNAVENSAPSPSSESSESSLVLSSSASSTSSHSVHANPGSIVSHDQVRYRLKFFAKHNAVSNVNKGLLKIWPQNK